MPAPPHVRAGLEEIDGRREHNREEHGDREQGEDLAERDDQVPKEERGTDDRDTNSPESCVAPQRDARRHVIQDRLRFDAPVLEQSKADHDYADVNRLLVENTELTRSVHGLAEDVHRLLFRDATPPPHGQ